MKKKIIICIVICYSFVANSTNYIDYFKQMNHAKILIANNKIDSALFVYQCVFKEYPKHFYKDVHNACVCAIYKNDMQLAKQYAKELVLLGYELKDFASETFARFRESHEWKDLENEYNTLYNKYLTSLNTYQYNKYKAMLAYDQKLSRLNNWNESNLGIYEFTRLLQRECQQNGLPIFMRCKNNLAFGLKAMYTHFFKKLKMNSKLSADEFNLYQEYCDLHIDDDLMKQVKLGNLSANQFVDIVYFGSNQYGICSEIKIVKDFEKEKISFQKSNRIAYAKFVDDTTDFVTIDSNRNKIGLLSLQEEYDLQMSGTWYTIYPFQKIKNALKLLDNPGKEKVRKTILEIELNTQREYNNNLHKDLFLKSFHVNKHSEYIGIENYYNN